MGTPIEHAQMSSKRFGGKPEDYIEIHELMDSSKSAHSDLRHRALTHNSWFLTVILEKVFGMEIENHDGKKVSVRRIGLYHILEDYKGNCPSASDFISCIEYHPWMDNAETERPPSCSKLPEPDLDKLYLKETPKIPEEETPDTRKRPTEMIPIKRCGSVPGMDD